MNRKRVKSQLIKTEKEHLNILKDLQSSIFRGQVKSTTLIEEGYTVNRQLN